MLTKKQIKDLAKFVNGELEAELSDEQVEGIIVTWIVADMRYRVEKCLDNNYEGWGRG